MGCRECCAQFGLLVLRLLNMVVGVRHLGVWVWAGLDKVWYHIFSRLAIVLCGPQLVGAGFVAYGAYLYAENGAGISGWAYTMMGVGLVVMVLALSLVLCGYKRPWFIKLVRVRGGSITGVPVVLTVHACPCTGATVPGGVWVPVRGRGYDDVLLLDPLCARENH